METPAIAMICYCILAIGVTTVVAQDKSKGEQSPSSQNSPSTGDQATSSNQVSPSASKSESRQDGAAIDTENKSDSKETGSSDPDPSNSPSKSFTSDPSLLTTAVGESAFKVTVPDWFKDADSAAVAIEAFGLTHDQLQSDVRAEIRRSAHQVIDELLGSQAHQYVHFSDQELQALVSREEFRDGFYSDDSGDQPCEFYYAHLDLGSKFQREANKRWIETKQESRLLQYGLITGATLLLIGFVFGGIKLNSATSGFYQGRLQFFVAVVILGVIAAGVYFGTQIDWI